MRLTIEGTPPTPSAAFALRNDEDGDISLRVNGIRIGYFTASARGIRFEVDQLISHPELFDLDPDGFMRVTK